MSGQSATSDHQAAPGHQLAEFRACKTACRGCSWTTDPCRFGAHKTILAIGCGLAAKATHGADVVVTAVGPNFATRHNPRTTMTSPADLHQRLARTIVAAIKQSAAPARLIAVSTASMGPADKVMGPGPRLLFRFFRTVPVPNLGRVGQDLQAMEDVLAASSLDWYALRPVKLTDGPLTRNVEASDRFTMKTISRADLAWQILALAEDRAPRTPRTPVITSGSGRKPRPAAIGDQPRRQAPTVR